MKKKEFKAESKRMLDLMINSIYTNKEIFLRELISNASDAIDKLYYLSLTNKDIKVKKKDLQIKVDIDKEKRIVTITDNGIGMNQKELESNLGTIAKSGSLDFKEQNAKKKDIDIIGQFGVGFYSAFMVSNKVEVNSKAYGSDEAYSWISEGAEGYEIKKTDKNSYGTEIIMHIKNNTDEEDYDKYLDSYEMQRIIVKYSNYIRYPIKMNIEHEHLKEGSKDEYETHIEEKVVNSMIPLWKKNKNDVKEEDYNNFYTSEFNDYEKPIKVIHSSVEGQCSYNSLLFVPSHVPYDYYTKDYEKGLQLYSNGVLIMDKCADLLPDYYSFVKGLVDSQDLSLNISREMLQHDRQLNLIKKNIKTKITKELNSMLETDRDNYEKFYKAFGIQLKVGIYADYGMNKDELKDLILFYSGKEKKYITLKEYVEAMKDGQDKIFYACGESTDKVDLLPQVEAVKDKDYDILYLIDYIDEFVIRVLDNYSEKKFINVCTDNLDLSSEEEKNELYKINEENKSMLSLMKDSVKGIEQVRFTDKLKNHPVCLTTEGDISIEMEKVINAMPEENNVKAKTILEINKNHPIMNKLNELYNNNKESLDKYTKVLYAQARLIEGLTIDNPTEISNLICDIIAEK